MEWFDLKPGDLFSREDEEAKAALILLEVTDDFPDGRAVLRCSTKDGHIQELEIKQGDHPQLKLWDRRPEPKKEEDGTVAAPERQSTIQALKAIHAAVGNARKRGVALAKVKEGLDPQNQMSNEEFKEYLESYKIRVKEDLCYLPAEEDLKDPKNYAQWADLIVPPKEPEPEEAVWEAPAVKEVEKVPEAVPATDPEVLYKRFECIADSVLTCWGFKAEGKIKSVTLSFVLKGIADFVHKRGKYPELVALEDLVDPEIVVAALTRLGCEIDEQQVISLPPWLDVKTASPTVWLENIPEEAPEATVEEDPFADDDENPFADDAEETPAEAPVTPPSILPDESLRLGTALLRGIETIVNDLIEMHDHIALVLQGEE